MSQVKLSTKSHFELLDLQDDELPGNFPNHVTSVKTWYLFILNQKKIPLFSTLNKNKIIVQQSTLS